MNQHSSYCANRVDVYTKVEKQTRNLKIIHNIKFENFEDLIIKDKSKLYLNPDIAYQMIDNSVETIKHNNYMINIIDADKLDDYEKEGLKKAIEHFFKDKLIIEEASKKNIFNKSKISGIASLFFFFIVFFVPDVLSVNNFIFNIVIDIFKVASWMLMWQAMFLITFDLSSIKETTNLYKDILNTKFNY